MYFNRKAYNELLTWKEKYADRYAMLLEGARRVGKSTIAKNFAENEYRSYIFIDFAVASKEIMDCFEYISELNTFFLRLQTITGIKLYEHESLIVFDEIQLFPKARQAIKYLVADGRYHYIETGSLISIRANVKDILIPSEEMKLQVHPMDYEEFLAALGKDTTYEFINELTPIGKPMGQGVHRMYMREFRTYMAVGGMPQAVEEYLKSNNFQDVDLVKREIINLYEEDFRKIDKSGKTAALYHAVPAQLAKGLKRFSLTGAIGGKKSTGKNTERLFNILDSKTVVAAYNTTSPDVSLAQTKDLDLYKLYLADTGLFVTLMFIDRPVAENTIYKQLLSDKLPANLGYLFENAVAQILPASGRELYFHTWDKEGSTHKYEVDFLVARKKKIIPMEVKSSGLGAHESIDEFSKKYSKHTAQPVLISQKDFAKIGPLDNIPVYALPAYLSQL